MWTPADGRTTTSHSRRKQRSQRFNSPSSSASITPTSRYANPNSNNRPCLRPGANMSMTRTSNVAITHAANGWQIGLISTARGYATWWWHGLPPREGRHSSDSNDGLPLRDMRRLHSHTSTRNTGRNPTGFHSRQQTSYSHLKRTSKTSCSTTPRLATLMATSRSPSTGPREKLMPRASYG